MKKIIRIKRTAEKGRQFLELFLYEGDGNETVIDFLEEINSRSEIVNADGKPSQPISFNCSCKEKKCGACAMVIDGKPRLACTVHMRELKENALIEPLSKFPVIRDLSVDRTIIYNGQETLKAWPETPQEPMDTDAVRCLMCGLCLEVCPNYIPGSSFTGGAGVAGAARGMDSTDAEHTEDVKKEYMKHFFRDCGQSLSCVRICPMNIPLDKLQARLAKKK
ncbi:MAG: succinate dehydrogenase [Oscillospiraceae bacterium]|nr:succinate dehydrogenase [Oscillospiraceae bacterium]